MKLPKATSSLCCFATVVSPTVVSAFHHTTSRTPTTFLRKMNMKMNSVQQQQQQQQYGMTKRRSSSSSTSTFCRNHHNSHRMLSSTSTTTQLHMTTTTKNVPPKLTNPQMELLDQVDVFIFDCDGVIWRGDSIIDGIPATLRQLRALGKRMFFVTNNSTKSRKGYKSKFDSLGLSEEVKADEIFSSSFAAAAYFEQIKFKETGKKIYVIGEIGICEELDLLDLPYVGGPMDKDKIPAMNSGDTVTIDPEIGAVVVGFDRYINYYKIQYAQLCINELNAQFIATNLDAVTHLTDAQEWAGNGSMVGAIKGCTGVEPIVVGKPSPLMIEYIETKFHIKDRQRICMVGDRLDTDILFGTDNGLRTVLVLSGVTSEEKVLNPLTKITPDYYTNTINDFFTTTTEAEVTEAVVEEEKVEVTK